MARDNRVGGTPRRGHDYGRYGPLAWGQYWGWVGQKTVEQVAIPAASAGLILTTSQIRIQPGMTVEEVRIGLEQLEYTHESLRTTFHLASEGYAIQSVHQPGGGIAMELFPSGEAYEPSSIMRQWLTKDFDLSRDWPVRCAVILDQRGFIEKLWVAAHHIIADRHGIAALAQNLENVLSGKTLDGHVDHPLSMARYEQSPEGQARSAASIDYYLKQLERTAHMPFPEVPSLRTVRHKVTASISSERLNHAVVKLQKSYRVPASAIIAAAISQSIWLTTGYEEFCFHFLYANRGNAASRNSIVSAAGWGVLRAHVDPGESFETLCTEGASAMLRDGLRSGYNDASDKEIALARRHMSPVGLTLNLVVSRPSSPYESASQERKPDPSLLTEDDVLLERNAGNSNAMFCTSTEKNGVLTLIFGGKGDLLPDVAFKAIVLQAANALLVAAQEGGIKVGEIAERMKAAPPARKPPWELSRGRWVHLERLKDCICKIPGVASCEVSSNELADGRSILEARVEATSRNINSESLRKGLADQYLDNPSIILPDVFHITHISGTTESVRMIEASPEVRRAESAIIAAFNQTHPGTPISHLDLTYAHFGGRYDRVLGFIDKLRTMGYEGVLVESVLEDTLDELARLISRSA